MWILHNYFLIDTSLNIYRTTYIVSSTEGGGTIPGQCVAKLYHLVRNESFLKLGLIGYLDQYVAQPSIKLSLCIIKMPNHSKVRKFSCIFKGP